MKLLILNAGSSSLRFAVMDKKSLRCLYKGRIERIGIKGASAKNHTEALTLALDELINAGILKSKLQITAVGHRVVHGGEKYTEPTLVDKKVLKNLRRLNSLAPLHNPANIEGIIASMKILPRARQVAVFDTSFYKTLPPKAYLYGVPFGWHRKYGIRKYGFHGTSHKYVSHESRVMSHEKVESRQSRVISCHLGNGCSITASLNGKAIDTSMGFTPLEGVIMGTRSGSIDPAIIFYLMRRYKMTPSSLERILEKESGLKGISGLSSDIRDLRSAIKTKNDPKSKLALEILAYQTAKYIGAYSAALNGVDCIIFTGGIGENAFFVREDICKYLGFLGVQINLRKNKKAVQSPQVHAIHKRGSRVAILVIPTNEELQIAKEILGTTHPA